MFMEEYEMIEIDKNEVSRRADDLGKWIWILFWLFVPSTIAGIFTIDSIAEIAPPLYLFGEIINIICVIVYGVVLLKMSTENEHYRTAGICCIISGVVDTIVSIVSGGNEDSVGALIISIPLIIVGLVGEYNEYVGHEEEVRNINEEMADRWERLWKWYIGMIIATFCAPFIVAFLPFIGLIVLLVAALGAIIVSIMKLVYLYETAKLFRNYGKYKPIEEESLDEYRFNL